MMKLPPCAALPPEVAKLAEDAEARVRGVLDRLIETSRPKPTEADERRAMLALIRNDERKDRRI